MLSHGMFFVFETIALQASVGATADRIADGAGNYRIRPHASRTF
jgi:hypothetical protein